MAVIYAVTCSQTGKAYIGVTAAKLAKRFREHKSLAKSGKHYSQEFSEEWRKYGDRAFTISVLEVVKEPAGLAEKREAEQRWLDAYSSKGLLLNALKISFGQSPEVIARAIEASRHVAGNRWTPEANRKRSEAQLGSPKGHGAKISATKQAQKAERERMMR